MAKSATTPATDSTSRLEWMSSLKALDEKLAMANINSGNTPTPFATSTPVSFDTQFRLGLALR